MTERQFTSLTKLSEKGEIEKAELVAFYSYKINSVEIFSISELTNEITKFGLSKPNSSRLKINLLASRSFIKAGPNKIRLNLRKLEALEKEYPDLKLQTEEILSDDNILPLGLYSQTRGYIERVAKQINSAYQHNLFDCCAMMMRRLIEMLIILSYKHLKREGEITDINGGIHGLSYLINYSLSNRVLNLTKSSEDVLDDFRQLGNYSAHGVEYSCKKGDIDRVRISFRACVEELLYKSFIKK